MPFLNNAWYVAAWDEDVSAKPFSRTLLGKPVVFYRREDGTPVALPDRCPHRFVRLSKGKVEGNQLVCGYHGLRFDSDGSCLDKRFNQQIRDKATLVPFPVVERYRAIWIWMGDPARANPELIPDFSFLNDPKRLIFRGTTHAKANYQLEIDNLMDLTHLDYVHIGSLSTGQTTAGKYKCTKAGNTVHSDWWTPGTQCPHQFRPYISTSNNIVDLWMDMRWDAPGIVMLDVGVAPPGQDRKGRVDVLQGHFATPETENTTHYLWIGSRMDVGEPPEVNEKFCEFARNAFENEDLPFIEAAQDAMKGANFWKEDPVVFPQDTGALRARRTLDDLIRNEQKMETGVAAELA